MSENAANICPNCQHQNSPDFHFCEECGQKNRPLKITFYEFIKDFVDVVFNLDNRFWKTIKTLFIPGKLTKIFFQGKRKSYYHPLRLYLVSIIILFAALSLLKVDNIIQFNGSDNLNGYFEKQKLITDQGPVINSTLDSLKQAYSGRSGLDLIDSVASSIYFVNDSDTIYMNRPEKEDSTDFTILFKTFKLSAEDMFVTDIDTVLEDNNMTTFVERIAFRQFLKGARDLGSLTTYVFANLTWLFLALIPVFALILKIFYLRRKRLYMEHFVFLLHLFSALAFILAIAMSIMIPLDGRMYFGIFAAVLVAFYPFIAFKAYYGQGLIKTFIKYLVIGFFFLLAFFITFLVFVLITAALF